MSFDQITTILFDFHDTLANTPAYGFDARRDVLLESLTQKGLELDAAQFSEAYRRAERVHRDALQEGREIHNVHWLASALQELGCPHPPESDLVVAAIDAYFDRFVDEVRVYEEVDAGLTALGTDYRLGIVSNFTDPRPVRETVRRNGWERYFECVVVSAEVGWRKPHGRIFEVALAEMSLQPGEVLYVGDHPISDVQGGRSAGMATCRIARPGQEPDWYLPWSDTDEFEEADLVVEDLMDLHRQLATL